MNIHIAHTKIPLKHSEMLGIVGMISNTAYQILTGFGYDMSDARVAIAYISSVVTNTGSSIVDKWEKGNDEHKD